MTIIIATYNSANTLRWTLQSVQRQDFQDFEVRVIGDACTDDSEAIVASLNDPRFSWKNLPQNQGTQSGPNNQGLKDAKGSYIAYLGHDDLWFPWHLTNLVSCLETTNADFVFALCSLFSPTGIQNPMNLQLEDKKTFEDHFTPPSSWLHRRDLIDTCGFWSCDPKNLRFHIDVEFLQRAFQYKKSFRFCPQLSVIKFPSPWWNSYKITRNYPQEPFLMPLCNNPKALQTQILTDMVIHLNNQLGKRKRWGNWIQKLLQMYGKDRFPLFHVLRWRFQRKRRRAHLRRGLPPIR